METSFKEGMEYSRWFDITKEMVMQFAELTGDRNPVHLDEAYAKETRFGKCIAPGMLIGGLISRIIGMDFPGNGSIYMGQELKFYRPVYVGGRICITCVIESVDREKGRLRINNTVTSEDKSVLTSGVSEVKLLKY